MNIELPEIAKYDVYLFQYSQCNKQVNRFYAKKSDTLNHKSLIRIINGLQIHKVGKTFFPELKSYMAGSPEDIANIVEKHILKNQDFVRLSGIKEIRESYKGIIRDVFKIEIKKQHLWATSNQENYIGKF